MAWLKSKVNDSLRGGRPLSLFAKAVAPCLNYSYSGKTCEFYDEQKGVWITEGAEARLRERMEKALLEHLSSFRITPVEKDTKLKYVPVLEPPDLFLLDPTVQSNIFSCLQGVPSRFAPQPLDSHNYGIMMIMNRVTLDFRKPYAEQLRDPAPEDRNMRHSPMSFTQCGDQLAHSAGSAIAEYLRQCDPASTTPEDVAAFCVPKLLDMMERGAGAMFRHVY